MYALIDCNNFFVSCERIFRPDLEGKPVMVLSGNDGCVIARSNEVKTLGIKMGVPYFQVKNIVEKEKITCFSTNFSLYGDISARIMSILSSHTTRLQQYSIDEAFITLDHVAPEHYKQYCEDLVRKIRKCIGVPVSIGIAPTKTLAKVASKFAKQYPAYHGACAIVTEEQRVKALSMFPIEDVWGIGRRISSRLAMAGIKSAGDLAARDEVWVSNFFTKPSMQTWQELRGIDSIILSDLPEKQSITVSRSFASPVCSRELLEANLSDFLSSACAKLRQQQSVAGRLVAFASTSRFINNEMSHAIVAQVVMPVPTSNVQEMLGYMLEEVRGQWRQGAEYKRAGVYLTNIVDSEAAQQDFFDERDREKDDRLQHALDSLNNRYGKNQVRFAVQSSADEREKTFRLEHLSPRYTTHLDEVMVVKI